MPDYNPAVAAGYQPQQPNLLGSLEGIAQLQIGQAHAGLYSLQALQQQNNYNALGAVSEQMRAGESDPNKLYQTFLANKGSPEMGAQILNSTAEGNALRAGGGMDPSKVEALTGAARNRADIGRIGQETTNLRAQYPGIAAESETKIAGAQEAQRKTLAARSIDLYNNPSPDNAQDMLNDHSMHMSALNRNRLALAAQNGDTNAIKGMAAEMQSVVMSPEERAALVQSGGPSGTPTGQSTQPGQPAVTAQTTLRTPQQTEVNKAFASQTAENIKNANEKAVGAAQAQNGLLQLRNDLIKLPQNSGFLTPGEDAGKRAAIAKGVNSALTTAGFQPVFDQGQVAAAEAAQKGTVRMGFDLAKTLGSREAAMIVNQSIGVQPGIGMTPEGNRRIMAGLLVASQRDRDYAQFLRGYDKSATPGDADQAFNQAHPVSGYVDDVEKIMSLEQKRDAKGQSPVDRLVSNPKLAKDFDAKFGGNMSRYFGNPAQ